MSAPFLSVGIPTYKRPHRLRRLLETLAQQKGVAAEEWEVVVSDNCSLDDTQGVVDAFRERLPNLRSLQNTQNIGGDLNMRSLFDKALGDYVWVMPDDDFVNGDYAVASLLRKLRARPVVFAITNAKSINTDTGILIKARFNSIEGDIFLEQGRDILNILSDFDLIGWQRVVFRRNIVADAFADKYASSPAAIVALALAACTKGAALIIGEPLAIFCDGDATDWRVRWPSICMQDMPEVLLDAVDGLGYSSDAVSRIIDERKTKYFGRVVHANLLLFQLFGISWSRLARIYGWPFLVTQLIIKAPLAVPVALIWPWRKKVREWRVWRSIGVRFN